MMSRRLAGVTLLEVLIALIIAVFLFSTLANLVRLSERAQHKGLAQHTAGQIIQLRSDLRRGFARLDPVAVGATGFTGTGQEMRFFVPTPLQSLPHSVGRRVILSVTDGALVLTQVAVDAANEDLARSEQRVAVPGMTFEIAYLQDCLEGGNWEPNWTAPTAPLAIRVISRQEEIWPDYVVSRPLRTGEACPRF